MTESADTVSGSLTRIDLVNPLPVIQRHYEDELLDVLAGSGRLATVVASPPIELSGAPAAARLARGASVATKRLRVASRDRYDLRIVMWPVFGLADPATWLLRRRATWLVIHDPQPLRRQAAMGALASRAGRFASRHGVGVITHSQSAADVLAELGWQTTVLPHPILKPAASRSRQGTTLTVVGQWKPARAMDALAALAKVPQWSGQRRILGRGWPVLDGWAVDSRFAEEPEIDEAIDTSACVVVPYDRYFQSGIAVRCLERLTPVVGREHPFLTDLLGPDWPGIVTEEDWAGAAARACAVTAAELATRRDSYWRRCRGAWDQFVSSRSLSDTSHDSNG